MQIQSLNGTWLRRVGYGKFSPQEVPYSTLPVGHSECKRTFDLTQNSDKVFLRFEGVTYFARVIVNGVEVGTMLPYSRYDFEITDIALQTGNELLVLLEDTSPVFGPSEGWENYGGIIRSVCLLYANETYLEDAFFISELKDEYTAANFSVRVKAHGEGEAKITLSRRGKIVCSYTQKTGETLEQSLNSIELWSPESPALYDLSVELFSDGKKVDEQVYRVGFREFSRDGHYFLVNGKRTFLLGVCRHDTYGECGHTLTEEQILEDFRLIKQTGCNYVRLVHYPHDKRVLDIADEMGLFVSEEPGLWWSDTANEEISSGSLEVLRRVIERDKNHPSVAFWLCFNECKFTEKFLHDSAELCKRTDPTRLVSGANCMSIEETKVHFEKCGFDFYTMHPYYATPEKIVECTRELQEKPLLFTEWGGFPVYDNPRLLGDFIATMRMRWRGNDEIGYLAGASFWNWAEIHEYGRGRPACADGLLKEALIDIDRKPTMIFEPFIREWAKLDEVITNDTLYTFIPRAGAPEGKPLSVLSSTLSAEEGTKKAWQAAREPIARYFYKKIRSHTKGPYLLKEEFKGVYQTPYAVADGENVVFGGGKGKTLTFLCASLPKGYPLDGEYGEEVAVVTVRYADGREERLPLLNGRDITTALGSFGPSRINPIAENAVRFADFHYDADHENYIVNALPLPVNGEIDSVEVNSSGNGYHLLFYGAFLS